MAFDPDKVREIAGRVAATHGLEVVEVELRGGGKARMLRIVLDKPWTGQSETGAEAESAGVTHEDCAKVSREVSTILDVEDVMAGGSYLLEVSSPGLDRKLLRASDYERFVGSRVKLSTRNPVNGNRHFEGRLEKFESCRITVLIGEAKRKKRSEREEAPQPLEIELANVEKANLVPEI